MSCGDIHKREEQERVREADRRHHEALERIRRAAEEERRIDVTKEFERIKKKENAESNR